MAEVHDAGIAETGSDLADRRAIELAKATADAAYFANTFIVIDDSQGEGTTPFKLWPAQTQVVWSLMAERLVLILKARQLGISWLCCSYALWLALFQPGRVILLFSQGEMEAMELLRRVKVMYHRLPDWLRATLPTPTTENTTEFGWSNGSFVRSLPATQRAGRSFTASLVIMDEAAHIQWAGQLYTAMKPTIDGGGQLVVLSTANGIGNLFHLLWTRAVQGLNTFRTIFLPWWARPERDAAWYAARVAEETEPGKVKQEYPSSATEAFLVSGRVRFNPAWIEAQAPNVRPSLPEADWPESLRGMDGLAIYALPAPGPDARPTMIGADVAEGLEHGDYSDAVVIDPTTWDELASLHGHWEPDEFAERLAKLGHAFNSTIAVERNNHGHAVLSKLRGLSYPRIYQGADRRAGWLTNSQTKPQAIDALAVALRDGTIAVRTQAALDEMQVYRIVGDGKTEAPDGYHDDRVMSRAIALMAAAARRPIRFGSQDDD